MKDPRRNKLGHEKANKLVALFHNLRLMSRIKKPAYVEPAVGWNAEDDKSGVVKFGLSNYESHVKKVAGPERPSISFAALCPPKIVNTDALIDTRTLEHFRAV